MAAPIPLRSDFDACQLRVLARKSKDGPQARRLLALAAIYEGRHGPMRPKLAGLAFRSSATGCCASTRVVLTVCSMARRRVNRPNSMTLNGTPSPA